ncbi:MAG: SCO family protein [Deltaproteobacteria bacterium]|nr:SCO family protein [Deltaproteobacteria bacterium]
MSPWRTPRATAFALVFALAPGLAWAHGTAQEPAPAASVATGEAAPLYEAPAVGSYELPAISRVTDHVLLDSHGLPARVPDLAPGQAALVSFVYANCGQGCPLALATLQRLDRELARRPGLAGRVRLVTVSFDPARDTPERMAELRGHLAPTSEWRFVTASDEAALGPVLADYGQSVMRRIDPEGADTGLLGHVLKVFLVDEFLQIRNVYSVGLLDARLIVNDLETVLAP